MFFRLFTRQVRSDCLGLEELLLIIIKTTDRRFFRLDKSLDPPCFLILNYTAGHLRDARASGIYTANSFQIQKF